MCIPEICSEGLGGMTTAGRVPKVSMVGWAALREEINESLVLGWDWSALPGFVTERMCTCVPWIWYGWCVGQGHRIVFLKLSKNHLERWRGLIREAGGVTRLLIEMPFPWKENCRWEIVSYGVFREPMKGSCDTGRLSTPGKSRQQQTKSTQPYRSRKKFSVSFPLPELHSEQPGTCICARGKKSLSFPFPWLSSFLSDTTPYGKEKSMKFKADRGFTSHI